jgi:hypothetical protein
LLCEGCAASVSRLTEVPQVRQDGTQSNYDLLSKSGYPTTQQSPHVPFDPHLNYFAPCSFPNALMFHPGVPHA